VDLSATAGNYWYRVEVVEEPCTGPDFFCKTPTGACEGPGACTLRPLSCPDIWIPVCGCDLVTYSNECFSDKAGVSVFWPGPCR
jgi:hypothetical protein